MNGKKMVLARRDKALTDSRLQVAGAPSSEHAQQTRPGVVNAPLTRKSLV